MKRIYLSCLVFLAMFSAISAQVAELYVVNPTRFEVLNGSNLPASKTVVTKLTAQVCPSEYEPLSFLINPKQSLSNITLEWTDFTGTAGTISKSALDPYIAKIWWQAGINTIYSDEDPTDSLVQELLIKNDNLIRVNWTSRKNELLVKNKNTGANSYITISDPSISFPSDVEIYDAKTLQPFNITDGKNRQIYLIFHTPDNAAAGTYTSQMTVKAGSTVIKTFPVEVKVLPFKLSEPIFTYSIYYTAAVAETVEGKNSFSGLVKDTAQYLIEMKDLMAHGIKYPQNNNGYASQKLAMGLRAKAGLPSDKIFAHATGVSFQAYVNGTMTLSELISTVNSYKNSFNSLGYSNSDIYYYGYDEANTSTYGLPAGTKSTLELVAPAYKEVRSKSGVKIYQAISSYGSNYTVGGPYIDLPVLFANRMSPYYDYKDILTEVDKYVSDGKDVLGYNNPQMGYENAEIYRRNHGLLAWKDDFTGMMDWKYQSTQGHIWNDWDNVYRDPNCTYPITKGVISTVQWEGVREAADDMRYLSTLLDIIKTLSGTKKTEAEAFVANLKNSLSESSKPDVVRNSVIDYILKLKGDNTSSDVTAPQLSQVSCLDPITVKLQYSEEVESVSAQNISNYTIGNANILSAVLASDNKTVTLITTHHLANTSYTISVKNVKDLAGNSIAANSSLSYSVAKTAVRINAGGPAITVGGVSYSEDKYYSLGHAATYTSAAGISGTDNDALYLTERWEHFGEEFSYKIPVYNSPYKLVLHFSEDYHTAAGKRIFDVSVNNELKLNDLDIYSLVGQFAAYTYTCEVPEPVDGFITLKFNGVNSGGSKISAIEAIPIDKITVADWSVGLTVSNASSTSKVLKFGQATSATNGVDGAYGESSLPPLPPDNSGMDARFVFPDKVNTSLVDYRALSETVVLWDLKLTGGAPYTISWNPGSLPPVNVYMVDKVTGNMVKINMKETNSIVISQDLDGVYIKMSPYEHIARFDVGQGWNIVSMPVKATDMSASALFAEAQSSDVYAYDEGYVETDVMELGKGYWVNLNSQMNFNLMGERAADSIVVKKGWNLIGYSDDICATRISSSPENIITSDLFSFQNGYASADSMRCGKGYWIKVNQNGVIYFGKSVAKANPFKKIEVAQDWGVISIVDAENNMASLYLAKESVSGNEYEMPPFPPDGIFDVRFSGGKIVGVAGQPNDILLRGLTYPIKISVSGVDVKLSDKFGGKILNSTLKSGQQLTVSSPLEMLEVSGDVDIAPATYSLAQNYPNPFNPTTNIMFTLPKAEKVRLVIYNALGEQVAELLNQQMEAGTHNVEFNGRGLASGMYIYKLETSQFTNVKKMLLLK